MYRRPFTKRITIHHSDSGLNITAEDIHRWHLARGYSGIGYHYVIYPDGALWEGRPEWTQGAHAFLDAQHEANTDGIGVCLIGSFMEGATPTEAQMQTLVGLIRDIRTRYADIPVVRHSDVLPTACPGESFPWAELLKRLEADPRVAEIWKEELITYLMNEGLIEEYRAPETPVMWWELAAVIKRMRGDA